MDKFVIRGKRKLNETSDNVEPPQVRSATTHVPPRDIGENSVEVEPSKSKSKNPRNLKYRCYSESYIKFGFVSNMCDPPLPLCVICNQTLSNHSMKPSLLHRHLVTNHGDYKDKSVEFFRRKAENVNKSSNVIHSFTKSAKVALETSYELAFLVAINKSPYTAVESLIIPGSLIIANKMLQEDSAKIIKTIPNSDTSVGRRIHDMAQDIVDQIVENIKIDKRFAMQIDESVGVSDDAELLIYVRYFDIKKGAIADEILGCKQLPEHTTGEDVFKILENFIRLKLNLSWDWCVSLSTDGAASLTGKKSGVIARIREINPKIIWQHCIIHRENLAAKKITSDLHETLNTAIKVVNLIKSRALNSCLFKKMCEEMGATYTQLFLHTEVRWLSRGRVLTRLFELKNEVKCFLTKLKSDLVKHFEDEEWICQLAYLTDIFNKFNELNLQLQGFDRNIFKAHEKIKGFYKKVLFWIDCVNKGNIAVFPTLLEHSGQNEVSIADGLLEIIKSHLQNLRLQLLKYFPEIEKDDITQEWITNPFCTTAINSSDLPVKLKESLLEMSVDSSLKIKFENMSICDFWCYARKEYTELSDCAITRLLPFPSTYLCEQGFYALTAIKTKQRNRLNPESPLILALTKIQPRIEELVSRKQAQPSH